ncbi:MAG: zinc ribbon domain-containing protein [Gemmatimonadales bacterium]
MTGCGHEGEGANICLAYANSENEMSDGRYRCPKCGHGRYEAGEIRAAGGFWSKIFDVQGRRFTTVTCESCSYTELFKTRSATIENVFDLFTN